MFICPQGWLSARMTIRFQHFDYPFSAFRLYSWRLSSSRVSSCGLSLLVFCKITTFGKYAVRLCPLVSAYVRVLTFRRIILTVRLLHLAAHRR